MSTIARLIELHAAKYPGAIARAVNRAATSTRAKMATRIAKDLGLRTGTVRDEIKITPAREPAFVARLVVSGKRIPLIEFKASGPEPSRGRGRGVRARLPGGAGRYPHAFIATMPKSGHRGVFERFDSRGRKGARGPRGGRVYELRGPSLPHVFHKITPESLVHADQVLRTNLIHELRFAGGAVDVT